MDKLKITPKLVEQTRRWLTRTIHEFHHSPMVNRSDDSFEQWHEDKAKGLLEFLNMSEADKDIKTKEFRVGSSNPRRQNIC